MASSSSWLNSPLARPPPTPSCPYPRHITPCLLYAVIKLLLHTFTTVSTTWQRLKVSFIINRSGVGRIACQGRTHTASQWSTAHSSKQVPEGGGVLSDSCAQGWPRAPSGYPWLGHTGASQLILILPTQYPPFSQTLPQLGNVLGMGRRKYCDSSGRAHSSTHNPDLLQWLAARGRLWLCMCGTETQTVAGVRREAWGDSNTLINTHAKVWGGSSVTLTIDSRTDGGTSVKGRL